MATGHGQYTIASPNTLPVAEDRFALDAVTAALRDEGAILPLLVGLDAVPGTFEVSVVEGARVQGFVEMGVFWSTVDGKPLSVWQVLGLELVDSLPVHPRSEQDGGVVAGHGVRVGQVVVDGEESLMHTW